METQSSIENTEEVKPKFVVIKCDFCGKSRSDVGVLICGPAVAICEECVALSFEIIVNEHKTLGLNIEFKSKPTKKS